MEGYDTPEPQTHICGGDAEIALAHRASDRVIAPLNSHVWTVEYGEPDNTGTPIQNRDPVFQPSDCGRFSATFCCRAPAHR